MGGPIMDAVYRRFPRNSNRHRRRQFAKSGERRAVLHAFTAARAYLAGWFDTLNAAAISTGSCVHYVRAALLLIEHGNGELIRHVIYGRISILTAAAKIEPAVEL